MDKFTNKILKFIRENRLINKGDKIIVGLSGGADSTALISVLNELKALLGIEIYAVHVNHGLRGSEAMRDEEFCRALCGKLGIRFDAYHADVKGYAAEHGLTEEEAGRIIRYRIFDETAERIGADSKKSDEVCDGAAVLTAVAHHADDQAETILLNLMRGTGLKGLGGMQPRRDNIIRPMLCVGKKDILKWLAGKNTDFVTDSTNLENDHTRNRIRNIIIPELMNSVNERACEHIAAAGKRIYEADEYIRAEARAFISARQTDIPEEKNGRKRVRLAASELKEKPQIFRIYAIIEALNLLDIPLKDWGDRHFNDIDRLLFLGKGAHTDLPGRAAADNEYRETYISVEAPQKK